MRMQGNVYFKVTVTLCVLVQTSLLYRSTQAFEASCLLVPIGIATPANIDCASSGGVCYKPIANLGSLFGCTGADCLNCCLGAHYECGTVGMFQNYSCCQRIPDPPTDTCTITNTNGTNILEPDCNTGLVCPSTGQGGCVQCNGTFSGICYKDGSGPLTDSCCSGYMCPPNVSGVTPCISGREETYKLLQTFSGLLLPLGIILGMILIIHNGYKLMTSQGDPQKLQEGKEGLTSAIIGLLFILMAVSILRVIIKALITGDTDPFST